MSEAEQKVDGDGFGLDKIARLEAKRAARVEDEQPKSLDPPFPFAVAVFEAAITQ